MTITLEPKELSDYRTLCNQWIVKNCQAFSEIYRTPDGSNPLNSDTPTDKMRRMDAFKAANPFPKLLPNY